LALALSIHNKLITGENDAIAKYVWERASQENDEMGDNEC
jgi:hypothetical protein